MSDSDSDSEIFIEEIAPPQPAAAGASSDDESDILIEEVPAPGEARARAEITRRRGRSGAAAARGSFADQLGCAVATPRSASAARDARNRQGSTRVRPGPRASQAAAAASSDDDSIVIEEVSGPGRPGKKDEVLIEDVADDDSDGIEVCEVDDDDDDDGILIEEVTQGAGSATDSSDDDSETDDDDDDDVPTIEEVRPPERTAGPAGALKSGFLQKKQKAPPSRLELARLKEEKRIAGNEEFARRRYKPAAKLYTEAVDVDPYDHTLYANRAACHLALGDWVSAYDDAEECVKLEPTFAKGCVCAARRKPGTEAAATPRPPRGWSAAGSPRPPRGWSAPGIAATPRPPRGYSVEARPGDVDRPPRRRRGRRVDIPQRPGDARRSQSHA